MSAETTFHMDNQDFSHPTNLDTIQHCLNNLSEDGRGIMGITYEEALDEAFHVYERDIRVPASYTNFQQLEWNLIDWPKNNVSVLFGRQGKLDSPDDILKAEGTIVYWNGSLLHAGLTDTGRIMTTKYNQESDDHRKSRYRLRRAEVGITQDEMSVNNTQLKQLLDVKYGLLYEDSESMADRNVFEPIPSIYDPLTAMPFESAGYVTPGMLESSGLKDQYLLTMIHTSDLNHLRGPRNQVLRKAGIGHETYRDHSTLHFPHERITIPTYL